MPAGEVVGAVALIIPNTFAALVPNVLTPSPTLPFSLVVLVPVIDPTVIVVVLPTAPFVPMVTVLVLPLAVTALAIATVCETVDWPTVIVPVPVVRPSAIVPGVDGVNEQLVALKSATNPLAAPVIVVTPVIFVTPLTFNGLLITT